MHHIINDCISKFKHNTFFRRMFLSYVITGCIIFILFSSLTMIAISRVSFSQMNATEQKMLKQSCNTGDLILRDLHSMLSSSFAEDPVILNAMTHPYSPHTSLELQNRLSDIMSSSQLIDSIYVVNFQNDIIYSTPTSIRQINNFFDTDIITYLAENNPKTHIYFSRKTILTNNAGTPVPTDYITSVYRNSPACAVVVNISQEHFQSIVNLSVDRPMYQTAIVDRDGNIISHSDTEAFAQNVETNPLFRQILDTDEDAGSFRFSGDTVNFVRSDTLGYSYISINSVNTSSLFRNLLGFIILFTILLLAVYLLCTIAVSLRTYSVFHNLKKNIYNIFNRPEKNERNEDEVENITKLLREAKQYYNSMETIQYQYVNQKQSELVRKLLVGTFTYLQDDMKETHIEFPYDGYAVLLIRIDNIAKMNTDTIAMIRYAVMNIGTELFEGYGRAYAAEINEYDAVLLLNFMSETFISECAHTLISYIHEFFDASITIAFDSIVANSLDDISTLYHNAKHTISYRLVYGQGSVIHYNDVAALDNTVSNYPDDLEDEIIKNITAQDDDMLIYNIHKFITSLCKMSFNGILLYTDRLLLSVDQFAIKSGMADDSDIATNIQEIISDLETLDAIEVYLLQRCRDLMLKVSNTKTDSKKDIMIKNILDYIEENYTDPNLSIDMIAGAINRSANYTRSMFKQSQGISISDYIAKKRFDEVCRLLIETNLAAQEIGKRLGLNAGSYFYTSFKKHTGYTPDQYRSLYKK